MISKQRTFTNHYTQLHALRFNVEGIEAPVPESMSHIHDLVLLKDIDMVVQQSTDFESDPETIRVGMIWVADKHNLEIPSLTRELAK
jgi:hypothetical protein